MKLLAVSLVLLLTVIPEALSIDCYKCKSTNGNCVTGKTTCPDWSTMDRCLKVKSGDKVQKDCGTESLCSELKSTCKNSGNCEVYCCEGDLCNGGVPLKPVTFLTLLAMVLAVAKYLM